MSIGPEQKLNNFLTGSLLRLVDKKFATFTFDQDDWKLLDRKELLEDPRLVEPYLKIWIDYISVNIAWIEELSRFSIDLNSLALADDHDGVLKKINNLTNESAQSLFVIKAIAALHVRQPDEVGAFFAKSLRASWLKSIFMDGLLSSTATTIPDGVFQDSTEFMLSNLRHQAEREAIRYLLRPQLSEATLAFKAYIALISHPFDSLQLLCLELEKCWAKKTTIPDDVLAKIQALANSETPELARLQNIANLIVNDQRSQKNTTKTDPAIALIEKCSRLRYEHPQKIDETSGLLVQAINHCRLNPYPEADVWEVLRVFTIHWGFSDIGRIIRSFMHSFYLFPREDNQTELRLLLPLYSAKGTIDELLASAPAGLEFARRIGGNKKLNEVRANVSKSIKTTESYNCRFRLNACHWQLQLFELDGRPRSWVEFAAKNIPIMPSYLTGIKWNWLEVMNSEFRISHFARSTQEKYWYIYVHLLWMIEAAVPDSVYVRSMLKKIVPTDPEDLCSKIRDNLGTRALSALIRYFLSPSEVLHLTLAKNPFAAIAVKITILDWKKIGDAYDDIFDQEYYQSESTTLQKSLYARHISKGEFEFSWPRLLIESKRNYQDYFVAAHELERSGEGKRVLGTALVKLDHNFGNKQAASYRLPNFQRQFATVILAIIDEVLTHPVVSLEAILSSRFRHDTLERQFRNLAMDIVKNPTPRLPAPALRALHADFWPRLALIIENWVNMRLHSKRSLTPDGMFNLMPNDEDIRYLVEEALLLEKFEGVFDLVRRFIEIKLDQQLLTVRTDYETNLKNSLINEINKISDTPHAKTEYSNTDKMAYLKLLSAATEFGISETSGWYTVPEKAAENTFTIDVPIEIAKQICGVESNDISRLSTLTSQIPADMRKPALFACLDIVANAQKHAQATIIRVSIIGKTIVFTNKLPVWNGISCEKIITAADADQIFSEGNSGLVKISAGMSAICSRPINLHVVHRKQFFHLILPMKEIVH